MEGIDVLEVMPLGGWDFLYIGNWNSDWEKTVIVGKTAHVYISFHMAVAAGEELVRA